MSDSLVIIPTYNEIENIETMLHAVMALEDHDFDVLVVDDNSPDGTPEKVRELIDQYKGRIALESRSGKLGLGTAYIHGFRWALEKGYTYIFEMDADFSHNPKHLIRLYKACKEDGADMAVGSRYANGGKVKNWPWNRILMSYGASLYVRMITWLPVKDPTAGFVCYTAEVLRTIDLSKIRFVGYAFQIEMKYATHRCKFKIVEVPITFIDRVLGKSKMSMSIFKEAFLGVIIMRLSAMFSNYRKD